MGANMIGLRIKQARLANGLTLDALAERMSTAGHPITKAALSKYELSKSVPRATFLVALAELLGVRTSYFVEEEKATVNWIAFRKLSKMPQKKQEQVKAFASHVVENQLWLQETLFPEQRTNLPEPQNALALEDAERIAGELRSAWNLGDAPIDSLTSLVEDNGGVVIPCSEISRGFDGLAGRSNRGFPVAVVSMQVPDDRRRYNLAHELGHLLMKCEGLAPRDEEQLANRFASALLVPAHAALQELGSKRRQLDLNELGILKRKYGFSMQGWVRRARDLEIIDDAHYRSLCIIFSKNHWKKMEPVPFHGKEDPTRLRLMTLRALAEGLITRDRAEQICPGCTRELEAVGPARKLSAQDLRRMPKEQRDAILAAAASIAAEDYVANRALTDFEAFGEDDFYDDYGPTHEG